MIYTLILCDINYKRNHVLSGHKIKKKISKSHGKSQSTEDKNDLRLFNNR